MSVLGRMVGWVIAVQNTIVILIRMSNSLAPGHHQHQHPTYHNHLMLPSILERYLEHTNAPLDVIVNVIVSPSITRVFHLFCLFHDCATPEMVQPGNDKVVNVKFTCDMVITIFFDYHLWPAMIQIV